MNLSSLPENQDSSTDFYDKNNRQSNLSPRMYLSANPNRLLHRSPRIAIFVRYKKQLYEKVADNGNCAGADAVCRMQREKCQ